MLNPAYKPASLRSIGMPTGHPDVVGLALNVSGGEPAQALRFQLTIDDAERMALALLNAVSIQRYRESVRKFHSPISSGRSNCDGSPHEGHAQ